MSKSSCIICDIDGTIAALGDRSPFDWTRVGEDKPIQVIINLLAILHPVYTIILFSGRDGSCRDLTEQWLQEHQVPYHELLMRKAGDKRKDCIVKQEMYETHIVPRYEVEFVLDDRKQVVDMWRGLGLTCLQVAEGNF